MSHAESGTESGNPDDPFEVLSKSDIPADKFTGQSHGLYADDYAHSSADALRCTSDTEEKDERSNKVKILDSDVDQHDLSILPEHSGGQLSFCHVSTIFAMNKLPYRNVWVFHCVALH